MKKSLLLSVLFVLISVVSVHAEGEQEELRVGITQEFEILNPIIHQMSASRYISHMVSHPLTSIDANWQWQCWLCKEYPTIENGLAKVIEENGKKKVLVTWEIKENAKWGDGTPITGKDVKLSWEIGSSPNVSVGEKEIYADIESIQVDSKNPKKFTMKFKKLKYSFAQLGTFGIIPAHLEGTVWEKTKNETGSYEKQTKYNTDSKNPGLYSGPYAVGELKLGSHVVLKKNPQFYGGQADIDKIVFKLIPDTATLEANLLSGNVDMVSELGFKFDQALSLSKRIQENPRLKEKYKVLFRDGVIYEHIDLNLRNPILQDQNVRQALVFAINRDKLVQALFENRQKKAIHNIHPLDVYYTEDVAQYPYDPKKSEELLDAAGWKKAADGYRYKDGKKLSLQLMTTAQDKTRELVQVYLQQEWKKVGVEITIKNEPARVYFGETVRKGKYPAMAMFAWTSSPDNPPRSTLHSDQVPTQENGYSGQNSGGWKNTIVDKNFDAIYSEFDLEKRKQMMHEILKEYTDEVPVIPLYNRAEIAVVPTKLKGFKVTGHQFYSSLEAQDWKLENEQVAEK